MLRRILGLAFIVIGTANPLAAQSTLDRVTFRQEGRLVTLVGSTEATPSGVTLKTGSDTQVIVAQDLVGVEYNSLPGIQLAEIAAARNLEQSAEDGAAVKAQAAFAELVTKAASAPERTRQHLAFREAMAAARVVDRQTGAEFAAGAKPVIERLVKSGQLTKTSWETWPAHRTAARLQAELGDLTAAAQTLISLAAVSDLTKEQQQIARLAAAAYQHLGDDKAAAQATLATVEQAGVADTLRDEFAILQAAGTPGLKSAVDAATNPIAKSLGYTLLGAMHEQAKQPREAMWSYLWTEAVYTDHPDATVAAIHRLVKLFATQGDKARADQFRARLPSARTRN